MIETTTARKTLMARKTAHAVRSGAIVAKQERSRVSREALLDAFMELLAERPYADIAVADIARIAGLTTGAVYSRFGDKRGLATAAHERFARQAAETMEAWGARAQWTTADPLHIIRSWTRGAVNFCKMYRPLLSLMMNDPAVRADYDALMGRPPRILSRLLRNTMLPNVSVSFDADVEWAARAALVVLERFPLDDDDLCDRIEQLLCRLIGLP